VREGAERRVRRERSKSGLFRHSASGRMRVSRARRGQARSGCAGCAGCAPRPLRAHPAPQRRGAPPQARGKKPRHRPHTPHRRTRGTRAGAPVSRGGPPTLQVTAQHHLSFPNTHSKRGEPRSKYPVRPHPVCKVRPRGLQTSPSSLAPRGSQIRLGRRRLRGLRPFDVVVTVEGLQGRNPAEPQQAASKRDDPD